MRTRGTAPAAARAVALFRQRLGGEPSLLVRAPGRVNVIGEHTDYNDGFVLPAALDRDLVLALRPRADRRLDVHAEAFDRRLDLELDDLGEPLGDWGLYVQATAWALREAGHALTGWEGALASDIPVGAGLSSSAAVELATARAFCEVGGLPWDPTAMALTAQRAENGWVGVASGMMDQMICALGRTGHALLVDCRSREIEHVPLPGGSALAVLDTGTRRQLAESGYNARREECRRAAERFGVPSLRDLTPQDLQKPEASASVELRRARHVVTENARTLAAAGAMRSGDAVALGALLDASHQSLRDDFEVSSPALDAIVAIARGVPGCLGARMTGGGFAGCAVALVEGSAAGTFAARVEQGYGRETGRDGGVHLCRPAEGAGVLPAPPQPGLA